jgi:hypothetical protein
MPESFDLKGILSLVLQVLGLTWANFRARAVKLLGEPVVGMIEQGAEEEAEAARRKRGASEL